MKVENFIQLKYPTICQQLEAIQEDPSLLQRRAAEVFLAAYEKALITEGIPAGIPLHDGLVFPAKDEAQLLRVKERFEEVASDMLGQAMPVKHAILSQQLN